MASHLARIVSVALLVSLSAEVHAAPEPEPEPEPSCAPKIGAYLEPALVILQGVQNQGPFAVHGAAGVRVTLCHNDVPRLELRGGLTFDATDTPLDNLLGGELELAVRAGTGNVIGLRATVRSERPFEAGPSMFGAGARFRRGPLFVGFDVSAVQWNEYYFDRTVTTHDTMLEISIGFQGKAGGYTGLVALGLSALGGLVVAAAAGGT